MGIIEKNWGKTCKLFNNDSSEFYIAWINKDKQSSKHYHSNKSNYFYVISGKLKVLEWRSDTIFENSLGPGDYLTIEPKTWHQFICIEDCILVEIYWITINDEDIIRDISN